MPTQTWRNWAGNQQADPVEVVHPRGTDEIAAAVVSAVGLGLGVRPVGAGHSFTAIAAPRDVQLCLDRHAGLVALDGGTGLVTVQSGMPLWRLNRLLEHAGLALANLGDIEAQTVVGAISTGTHGTGARFGGLATQVAGLELVLADGSTLACSATEHPEVFSQARVGLGALGVVSTVTLRTVPAFALRAVEEVGPLDALLESFDELADGTDHVDAYWYPHSRRAQTKRNTRLPVEAAHVPGAPLPAWRAWAEDDLLANRLYGRVLDAGRRVPALVRPAARVVAAAVSGRTYTDVSHRVFTAERRFRFEEMEYAVPREALLPLLRELVAAVERSDWRIAVPVEVRVAAADDIPLSTAHGRDTGYVAVHTTPGSPDQAAYFGTLERLAASVGGRPHWGKLHGLHAQDLRGRYPLFEDFVALRDRLDPTGVFANAHLDRVLGPAAGAAGSADGTHG